MEQLKVAVKSMSKDTFDEVRGRFLLKSLKERTQFESAFLRVAGILQTYTPSGHAKTQPLLIDLLDLPAWIKPLSALREPQNVIGTRLLGATPERTETHTLLEVFSNPSLMRNFSIGLHGTDESTGWGKTSVSLMLASVFLKATNPGWERQMPSKRYALVTSNIDAAKLVAFEDVAVWVMDEFDVADSEQQQFLSPAILKLLLTPRLQCTLRVKGSEVLCVPANLPRIFTRLFCCMFLDGLLLGSFVAPPSSISPAPETSF